MEGLFEIKVVPISDTIYSEAAGNMVEAQEIGDWKWYGDLCIEAQAILVEAGMLKAGQGVSVARFPMLLRHCHLDAQIPEGDHK